MPRHATPWRQGIRPRRSDTASEFPLDNEAAFAILKNASRALSVDYNGSFTRFSLMAAISSLLAKTPLFTYNIARLL